jgi:hypothetical protein
MPRYMQAGMPHTRFCPVPHTINLYINNTPKILGVRLALFADDTAWRPSFQEIPLRVKLNGSLV